MVRRHVLELMVTYKSEVLASYSVPPLITHNGQQSSGLMRHVTFLCTSLLTSAVLNSQRDSGFKIDENN